MLPSACMSSVTLVHPAKAVERNEIPFGRDCLVVPSNIVSDMGPPDPPREGEIRGSELPVHSHADPGSFLVFSVNFLFVCVQ